MYVYMYLSLSLTIFSGYITNSSTKVYLPGLTLPLTTRHCHSCRTVFHSVQEMPLIISVCFQPRPNSLSSFGRCFPTGLPWRKPRWLNGHPALGLGTIAWDMVVTGFPLFVCPVSRKSAPVHCD